MSVRPEEGNAPLRHPVQESWPWPADHGGDFARSRCSGTAMNQPMSARCSGKVAVGPAGPALVGLAGRTGSPAPALPSNPGLARTLPSAALLMKGYGRPPRQLFTFPVRSLPVLSDPGRTGSVKCARPATQAGSGASGVAGEVGGRGSVNVPRPATPRSPAAAARAGPAPAPHRPRRPHRPRAARAHPAPPPRRSSGGRVTAAPTSNGRQLAGSWSTRLPVSAWMTPRPTPPQEPS